MADIRVTVPNVGADDLERTIKTFEAWLDPITGTSAPRPTPVELMLMLRCARCIADIMRTMRDASGKSPMH